MATWFSKWAVPLLTVALGALTLGLGAGVASAQDVQAAVGQQRNETGAERRREGEGRDSRARRGTSDVARDRRLAQSAATAAGTGCQVTEAGLLGQTTEGGHRIYEVACSVGTGFIIIAAEPPKAYDCVGQAGYAAIARRDDPAAEVGLQCSLDANQNTVQIVAGYGRDAGLECEVDQAIATGVGAYEIGCAGRDGWLLNKDDGGWSAQSCWMAGLKTPGACMYSSAEEAAAQWPRLVAGSDAAACVPVEVAWMGDGGDRGSFYEIRCRSGEGIIVRFKDDAAQQTYSCIDAPQVFRRSCSLTLVDNAAPVQ